MEHRENHLIWPANLTGWLYTSSLEGHMDSGKGWTGVRGDRTVDPDREMKFVLFVRTGIRYSYSVMGM